VAITYRQQENPDDFAPRSFIFRGIQVGGMTPPPHNTTPTTGGGQVDTKRLQNKNFLLIVCNASSVSIVYGVDISLMSNDRSSLPCYISGLGRGLAVQWGPAIAAFARVLCQSTAKDTGSASLSLITVLSNGRWVRVRLRPSGRGSSRSGNEGHRDGNDRGESYQIL